MPTATTPLGKPAAAAKPAGFTKPAGLSRQTAPAKSEETEEEEVGLQPVHIGISAVALILSILFVWTVYTGDQVPNRTSDYLFGQPTAADAPDESSSDSEDGGDEGESDGEEEEEDEEE